MLQCSSIKDKAPHKNKEKKSTLQRNRQDTLYNRIKNNTFLFRYPKTIHTFVTILQIEINQLSNIGKDTDSIKSQNGR